MKRRPGVIFWGALALCLLLGYERILADPNQQAGTGSVVITEFSAVGTAGLFDEDEDRSDWIELTNQSAGAVDLDGWMLSDDPMQLDKWTFPSVMLGSGESLLVFASEKDRRDLDAAEGRPYLHTNFKLDSDGGFLALSPPTSRQFLDASVYDYPAQTVGLSYGLATMPDGSTETHYLEPPTPGAPNLNQMVWQGLLPPVTFSAPHAIASQPISVTLSIPTPSAEIRYTTDGSIPTFDNGMLYTAPLTITQTTALRAAAFLPDYYHSPIVTQSYIFLQDVLTQASDPSGWPATWGTHRITRGPYEAGTPVQADYAVDSRVVNDPVDGPLLEQGLRSIPSLSLVTDLTNLDIYADPQARGRETERPVSVEWIEPGGEPGFQIDAGLRIQGGAGRWEAMPKHSFRLFFRGEYGTPRLEYRAFADSYVATFDTLVLRAGVDWGFAGYVPEDGVIINHRNSTYLNDAWARATQLATSGTAAHGRFVHLYLNGLYWGVYELVERPDASFASSYLGDNKEAWASISHGGYVSGRPDRFDVLLKLAQDGGLDDPERYATFLEFFNPAQFSDYVLVNWYAGNTDWLNNNWYVDVRNPDGRNHFFVWDAESTWENGANISLTGDPTRVEPFPNIIKLIFEAAWANPDFRMTFADRAYRHLFNDGALTDAVAQARWSALQTQLDTAIVGESARWGDARYPEQPISRTDWLAANQIVLDQMDGNGARLLNLLTEANLYPTLEPPVISPHGGEFTQTVTVTLSAPQGVIYFTTDDSDPRMADTGEPAPGAQVYREPLQITTGRVAARTWLDGEWSPLNEVQFAQPGQYARLVISEIMYNPYGGQEIEFLELKNIGTTAADLSGAYFEGIEYLFADGTTLAPGGHLVLARDFERFRRRYPEADVHGIYEGKLSDKGEMLTLYARNGDLLAQVTYDDEEGWPLSADGAGDSLVFVESCGDPAQVACWQVSTTLYGTPGTDEPGAR